MIVNLIRHAKTDANAAGQLSCSPNEPLNSEGLRQAQLLTGYLKTIGPFTLWCSPLLRVLQTVEPYLSQCSVPAYLDGDLCEGVLNLDMQARPQETTYCPYAIPQSLRQMFREGLSEVEIPAPEESVGSFIGRVKKFIQRIRDENTPDTLVVITHGHFIREFLNHFMGARKALRFPVKNCSETRVETGDTDIIHHVNRIVI